MRQSPYIVGLTGGIGSGKSTIAEAFVARGAVLVDTDAIAHRLTAPDGAAIAPIRAAFGPEVISPDGGLDRPRMREIVFADTASRRRLEAILHPMIGNECDRQVALADGPYVVMAVPLLVESNRLRKRMHRVLVVDCDEDTQVARVVTRGLTEATVRSIIAAQASRQARRDAADEILENDSTVEAAIAKVDVLHRLYLQLAQAHRAASEGSVS